MFGFSAPRAGSTARIGGLVGAHQGSRQRHPDVPCTERVRNGSEAIPDDFCEIPQCGPARVDGRGDQVGASAAAGTRELIACPK